MSRSRLSGLLTTKISALKLKGRFELFRKKFRSGGFVFAEFAIALPLLILLMYGLTIVGIKIFQLGREQMADYILESEIRHVMERITREARSAKEIDIKKIDDNMHQLKIIYHTGDLNNDYQATFIDVLETQIFKPHRGEGGVYKNINAKRQESDPESSPITGGIPAKDDLIPFGDTKINEFVCKIIDDKVLHITLEMESEVTGHKIKLNTAVFMPGYEL